MLKQPPSKPVLNSASKSDSSELLIDQQNNSNANAIEPASALFSSSEDASLEIAAVLSAKDETASEDSTHEKTARKRTKAKRWRRLSCVAIALSLIGGGTACAITQVAPAELQAGLQSAILPQRQKATPPVSLPNDPEVRAFTSTRDLFLTNQIFYRKVEALAGAVASPGTANPSEKAVTDSATGSPSKAESSSKAKDSKADAPAKENKPKAKAASAEKVTASAPPAPAPEQIAFTGTTIDSVLEMRVAVAKDVSAIGFATSSSGTLTDLDGNALKSLSPETASLASINSGLVVDGEPVAGGAFWIYPESGGYVAIGDRWYRGRVLVALRERGLIAVNYVLLGDYLYSVVGSEMSPGWAIESLKAQAVAARSYALTHNIHPASEAYFDLDNTQRFQAYKGISREANTTQAAVQATAGEFISYDGGIVESLYAASQEIVDDAHKGSGMSQLGAKDLAEQGYSYAEILAHYYPGTALGRIETDPE